MSIEMEIIEERNKKLVLPPLGELLSADGRRFLIRKWRPCMEVGCIFTVEVELVEAEEAETK